MGRIYRISIAIQFDVIFDELVGSMFDELENAERDTGFKDLVHEFYYKITVRASFVLWHPSGQLRL